jgi:CBS domain-containing protein
VVAVKMMALGIRHLPVVDAKGAPVGLISASDLVGMMEKGRAAG